MTAKIASLEAEIAGYRRAYDTPGTTKEEKIALLNIIAATQIYITELRKASSPSGNYSSSCCPSSYFFLNCSHLSLSVAFTLLL
jgi:hypothetical protein